MVAEAEDCCIPFLIECFCPYLKEELEEHYAKRKLDFPPKKNIALEIKFAQPHSLVTSRSA